MRHRRRSDRPTAREAAERDCATAGCAILECKPHECRPLAASTIRQIHFIISSVLTAAVCWEWISSNPAEIAKKPRQPVPDPDPPTAEQAARIVAAAWEKDDAWGALVWLTMVTGMRRGELLGLRWLHVDLAGGTMWIRRNYVRGREKDTKTHQRRRVALDETTVEILTALKAQYEARMRELGLEPTDQAFLFSHSPTCDRPRNPDSVSHRYGRMCEALGIGTHLHALRHYTATELLTAGVDLRTVACRLGHGGGGTTALRVYAAWVSESDRRAATILGSRMKRPQRSTQDGEAQP